MLSLIERALGTDNDVLCVDDGDKVLALLHAGERFDVVLCDLSMPTMGGALVYFEAALLAPEQARRFIFLTGGATNPGDQLLLDRVQQPTLDKPFSIVELRLVIDGVLVGG